jgi:hypothetical protein
MRSCQSSRAPQKSDDTGAARLGICSSRSLVEEAASAPQAALLTEGMNYSLDLLYAASILLSQCDSCPHIELISSLPTVRS